MLPDIESFYRDLGEAIKTERLRRKINQERLGEILELTRASIINLEKGRHRPSIYQVLQIASFFQIEYTDLIPFKTEKEKSKHKAINRNLKNVVTDQKLDEATKTAVIDFLTAIKK